MNLAALCLSIFVAAQSQPSTDSITTALKDEMQRRTKLHLGPMPAPYYVGYTVVDSDEYEVAASLGSLCLRDEEKARYLQPDVRIGSPELDNTNFASAPILNFHLRDGLPTDESYTPLRRKVWLITDIAYKAAVQNLQAKKAFLQENKVPELLSNLTPQKPTVHVGELPELKLDRDKWESNVKDLSDIFKSYPDIQRSRVYFGARRLDRWFLNTEGTELRDGQTKCAVITYASAQAVDGQRIVDNELYMAPEPGSLPDEAALTAKTKALAERVIALSKAPVGEEYLGPVLFQGQAAAELVSQLLAPNFGFAVEPLGLKGSYQNWHNPFKDAIGRRVLAPFLSVTDDPTQTAFGEQKLIGGFTYDDDGVPAQKLTLVENGILKTLCTSRIQTKWSKVSNGHSILGIGLPTVLCLSSTKTLPPDKLKARLMELGKEEGLKYVLLIKRIWDDYNFAEHPAPDRPGSPVQFDTPSSTVQPADPVLVYKVYTDDGHEELIRGMEFRYVTMRAFRDIDCTGDDAAAYPVQRGGEIARHLITPSLLLREFELAPEQAEHDEPPMLSSPLKKAAEK